MKDCPLPFAFAFCCWTVFTGGTISHLCYRILGRSQDLSPPVAFLGLCFFTQQKGTCRYSKGCSLIGLKIDDQGGTQLIWEPGRAENFLWLVTWKCKGGCVVEEGELKNHRKEVPCWRLWDGIAGDKDLCMASRESRMFFPTAVRNGQAWQWFLSESPGKILDHALALERC